MNTLRNQVIDQIFKLLAPLRSIYKDEVDKITNDLLNDDTKSFEEFISKYYNDVDNSLEFSNLVTTLVNNNLIASSFLDAIKTKTDNKSSIKQISVRPLNVKTMTFDKIKNYDLTKLDRTLYPISLNDDNEDKKENEVVSSEKVTPLEIAPVEIEPDYNTQPDIKLPFEEDNDNEIPDFNNYNQVNVEDSNLNINTNLDLPDISSNNEIQPIQLPTQEVISKEDIFKSIENNDEKEKNEDPNIKNTTQLGQLLQFPLKQDNYINSEVPQENTNLPSVSDMMNQNTTPVISPNFETTPTIEQEIPTQDTYVSIEPTYQENISSDTMNNQDDTSDVMPAFDSTPIAEPMVSNQTEVPQEDTNLPSVSVMMNQNTAPLVTSNFETTQTIEKDVPTQDTYVSIEPDIPEEDVSLPNPDIINQNTTSDVMPTFEINQVTESNIPSMPLPRDMIKNENISTPQKTEEELREEIENKVREAVREELKQEISELTNKTKEELKQEISEMATKTKEEVKQELTEKIREEEKNNILRIQNDYMNNATEFINSLNDKDEEEIYTSLRLLNDLRYMSHCIAHLSPDTLERFYLYIERKLNSPNKEFMDTIIEKRIKEILPPNISYNLELEATSSNEVFRKTA